MKTRIDQTVTFGHEGNAEAFQLHGWSAPEREFTWSIGPECGLAFPVPDAPHGCFIEIVGAAFAAPPKLIAQHFRLKVNGRQVGRATLSGPCTAAFYVAPSPRRDQLFVVSIAHPNATKPSNIIDSSDSRELAFAFQSVRVLTLLEPCRPWRGDVAFRALGAGDVSRERDLAASLERLVSMPAAKFSAQFESLGDNCELGFVQRKCGAEPLGLFRFSSAFAIPVLRGIDCEFTGLADRIEPKLEKRPTGPREWMIHEHSYQMRYHTFVHEDAATKEQMSARETTKLHFLRRKMVEDINLANKIFVLKRHEQPLSYAEVLPIFLALQRRGNSRLLWLTLADINHPAGLVHETHPGLMHGYVDRLWPPHDPSMEAWLTVLANAWELSSRKTEVQGGDIAVASVGFSNNNAMLR